MEKKLVILYTCLERFLTAIQLIVVKRDRVIMKYMRGLEIQILHFINFSNIKVLIIYYKFLLAK